jgi:predicted phage terminase large subunit-like protein
LRLLRELLAREEATTSLRSFTEYTNDEYQAAQHHERICHALEAVERGDLDRLIICMPPRHGKSELASRRFPAWYLGRNPTNQIIAASYNSDLSSDFGREVRNIVATPEYRNVFDTTLAPDSKAANRWHTHAGGSYVSAGVGTAITGRGAHVALIDDPIKDRAEADSELTRDNVWKWYTSTLYTRLMPRGAIVLIQTRWHDDDLAGRLLNVEGGDKWELLELPAEKDGAALWPEWYPMPALSRIRAAIGERDWSALYQQQPQPDEGTFFRRDWFKLYRRLPEGLRFYGASDYAVTEDGGDYTEHGVFGLDADEDIYVADWWSGQTPADKWIEAKCDLIEAWEPLLWGGEAGVIRKSIEPFMTKRMRERRAYCRIEWVPSVRDKPTRARSFQARASMGKVHLPDNEMGHRLLDQLLRFPAGAHDDAVDVFSLFGQLLDQTIPAMIQQTVKPEQTDCWGRRIREDVSWKTQ